jgi:hypothetical protein
MAIIAFTLGLMYAGFGIYWSPSYQNPMLGLVAVALYLGALAVTIFAFKSLQIPAWLGLINLLVATVLPRIIEEQITPAMIGTYATWYIGGLGVLLGATALRKQVYFAWGGLIIATAEIILWEGPENLLRSGWIGLVVMVIIGQAANLGLQQSERAIDKANQVAAAAKLAAKRKEITRESQVLAFNHSVPNVKSMLQRTIAQKGRLSEDDRREAMLLEADLSDEVMGGALVVKPVIRAARLARLRGVEVYLLDDGVLAQVDPAELEEIHHKVVDVVTNQLTGKVTIRATAGNRWQVSITAYERGARVPNVDWKF